MAPRQYLRRTLDRAFSLSFSEAELEPGAFRRFRLRKLGQDSLARNKAKVRRRLTSLLDSNGALDGSAVRSEWFPGLAADVFIS